MGGSELRKPSARAKRIQAKRDLLNYINAYASARGAAEWTNGYRAGRPDVEAEKHAHEMRQWAVVGRVEKEMRNNLQSYERLIRATARAK
jgi:hypothetical protein